MYQLSIIIFIILLIIGIRKLHRESPEKRRSVLIRYGLYSLVFIIVLLVISGRVHWIVAGIAGLLPLLSKLIAVFIRVFPFIHRTRKHNTKRTTTQKSTIDLA